MSFLSYESIGSLNRGLLCSDDGNTAKLEAFHTFPRLSPVPRSRGREREEKSAGAFATDVRPRSSRRVEDSSISGIELRHYCCYYYDYVYYTLYSVLG